VPTGPVGTSQWDALDFPVAFLAVSATIATQYFAGRRVI